MWSETHQIIVEGLIPEDVWKIWSDINLRIEWDIDTEWAKLEGPFAVGSTLWFKPKGGPKLSLKITECTPNRSFTDCFSVPFAKMYGIHWVEPVANGIKLTTAMQVTGPLAWLLRKVVAEKVVKELPAQTDALIKLAKQMKSL